MTSSRSKKSTLSFSNFLNSKSRYTYTAVASTIIALITYFHPTFWRNNKIIFADLFNKEDLNYDKNYSAWGSDTPLPLLFSTFFLRFLVLLIIISMPIPYGIFSPSMILGGVVGRIYGEMMAIYFKSTVNVRMLAVSGAAAFTSAVTRTTSPVLILLELTGQTDYAMGIFFSTLFGFIVSSMFTLGFDDTMMNIKKLPYLPFLFSSSWYKKTSAEIMSKVSNTRLTSSEL